MSGIAPARPSTIEEVAETLRTNERFILTTHEGPDGDALGSLLGMRDLLRKMGKDAIMFLAAKEFPLPVEYRSLPLQEIFHEPPVDLSDRVVIFLDCGNIDRMPVEFLRDGGRLVLNIDHHHDNTNFGDLNLVDPGASCTAEMIFRLSRLLDVEIDKAMATALYVGIITDTGKFMYDSTDSDTHRIAADLIDAGVDVDDVYMRLYESVPIEKVKLLARALSHIQFRCDGRLIMTYITGDDYEASEAGEEMTEGIIDHLRSIEGARVAAVVRDQISRGSSARKVSLRSSDGVTDVSSIARGFGGGGHVRAAGFSTELSFEEIADSLCAELGRSA